MPHVILKQKCMILIYIPVKRYSWKGCLMSQEEEHIHLTHKQKYSTILLDVLIVQY